MEADFEAAAKVWDKVAAFLAAEFAAIDPSMSRLIGILST